MSSVILVPEVLVNAEIRWPEDGAGPVTVALPSGLTITYDWNETSEWVKLTNCGTDMTMWKRSGPRTCHYRAALNAIESELKNRNNESN